MNYLITILLVFVTLNSYSQKSKSLITSDTLEEYTPLYEMHSQIWGNSIPTGKYNKEGRKRFKSTFKEGRKPILTNSIYIEEDMDENKINFYLHECLNEFREDYNKITVNKSKRLTKGARLYSKELVNNYKHSDREEYGRDAECIAHFGHGYLCVIEEDEDLNKIIAESCFDTFVCSPSHMRILLSEKYGEYGCGVTVEDGTVYVVVQANK